MNINEYQQFAAKGIHPETSKREPIVAFALGLAGESGEVIDDIKKRIFHGRNIPVQHTLEELGDVLWYVANIATQLGGNLEDIIQENVNKLRERYPSLYEEDPEQLSAPLTIIRHDQRVMYKGKICYLRPNGPHWELRDEQGKFIKFISRKEYKNECQPFEDYDPANDLPWN